ncbi:uncharacterized protein PITG_08636 [Phytophthora infestans T30-4]|uniref:Uncharacterized protein n=1 Tax=Phytophthora infestans (strain T30-4) TaxID=403677 RepID=D0NB40_PHYIT|nr:uncharacterized protein PITG_08636 [Phytophthora infestans T30-4]EEY55048.1 hypothetical protein PITG_08636 [Phytophthora infestans T30-4]|eukprot:XP_002903993.1 hypothetical protein PITG_08636 [Phytophthora infestans T30-4]
MTPCSTDVPVAALAAVLIAPLSIPASFFNSGDNVTTSVDGFASVSLPATTESPRVPSRSDVSLSLLTYLKSPVDVFDAPAPVLVSPPADAAEINRAAHSTNGERTSDFRI